MTKEEVVAVVDSKAEDVGLAEAEDEEETAAGGVVAVEGEVAEGGAVVDEEEDHERAEVPAKPTIQ